MLSGGICWSRAAKAGGCRRAARRPRSIGRCPHAVARRAGRCCSWVPPSACGLSPQGGASLLGTARRGAHGWFLRGATVRLRDRGLCVFADCGGACTIGTAQTASRAFPCCNRMPRFMPRPRARWPPSRNGRPGSPRSASRCRPRAGRSRCRWRRPSAACWRSRCIWARAAPRSRPARCCAGRTCRCWWRGVQDAGCVPRACAPASSR